MGNGASKSKIHATTCKKCKKVCVFGKVKKHEELWHRWRLHKKLFLKVHECETGFFTTEDFSTSLKFVSYVIKDMNPKEEIIALKENFNLKQLKKIREDLRFKISGQFPISKIILD